MSINVTVSGNPVCIKRGTMISSYDPVKDEFEKRRLMRLEQVRQQSKDIAENLRNKLRKEKSKCLSEIEKDGEAKLKNWQARKLLELQNQYEEALGEIGIGHKSAIAVEDEDEAYVEQQEINEKSAIERGRAAAEQWQIEKNEESLRNAAPIQRKKLTRDIENSRSSAVANLRKIKQGKGTFKKKKKRQLFDSDGENKVPQLFDIGELDSCSSVGLEMESQDLFSQKTSKEQQTSQINFQVPTSDKAAQTVTPVYIPTSTVEVPLDTRISDYIRRRERLNQDSDYCDFIEKELQLTKNIHKTQCDCCPCTRTTKKFPKHKESTTSSALLEDKLKEKQLKEPLQKYSQTMELQPPESVIGFQQPFQEDEIISKESQHVKDKNSENISTELFQNKHDKIQKDIEEAATKKSGKLSIRDEKSNKQRETIPTKPKITLKSSKDKIPYFTTNTDKVVHHYDHPNRFSKQYIPKSSVVEKVYDEDLHISPAKLSEDEIHEVMRQRDIEAHIRGQVALEKERIQREYKELLKKLPALQKQGRIYDIGTDKEKYHMAKDRLEDLERKRQNQLDNAYEELFVRQKPVTVTLPKHKDDKNSASSLNLATWDVDFERLDFTHDTNVSNKSRTEQLSNLLINLKAQKDNLLKEIENTFSKETSTQFTKIDSGDVKSKSSDYTQVKFKRKRSRDERPISPTSSDINTEERVDGKEKLIKKGTNIATVSPSPRKKAKLKSKKKILVLQNSSTQTTPKTGHSAATSPLLNTPVTLTTDDGKCVCPKGILDDLCEIVIRIKEDEKPVVTVNPPVLEKNVKIITEEKKLEESVPEHDDMKENTKKDISKTSIVSKNDSRSKKSDISKSKKTFSWKDSLSCSASSQSTSSTSYFELPSKIGERRHVKKSSENGSNGSEKNLLDPRLLTYIKKLLNMSRTSIDELAVSAVSDVSTPDDSIVETSTNNPLIQLKNVMKYFNLDFSDLQKQLSNFSDENSSRYNTNESIAVSSNSQTSEGGKSVRFKSPAEMESVTKTNKEEPNKLLEYADIAASCTKKISSLTAMIEKVRAEKKKILQSPPTSGEEKDISTTSYLRLPETKDQQSNSSSSISSSSHEELDSKLLTIDYSYAERLKNLTKEEIEIEKKRIESKHMPNVEVVPKIKILHETTETTKTTKETIALKETTQGDKKDPSPLFLDIPKLPRLEAPKLDDNDKKKKRPPPSKGLRTLGGPIVPHELSTIVEADSQVSTKVETPAKGASPKTSSSRSSSIPDILTEVHQKEPATQTTNSSDDVSEMETMETMLISIGMEWAIPTLKKTREALALSSSSGSGSKNSGELSLKEFLSKISSSTSTGESPGSMLSDSQSQGVSLIQIDNRRTSTPICQESNGAKKDAQPIFQTDSDLSSVREHSDGTKDKFYDLIDGSIPRTE